MERKYPGPDTGKIELERILNCMKENKYERTDSLDEGEFGDCYKLNFVKEIMYSDTEGTYINDQRIKVTIEFDTSFDLNTNYKDKNGVFEYNDKNTKKAQEFIEQIIDGTYDSKSIKKGSIKKGGQRKTKKNRKTKKK
jgi:hypothetical protein